MFFFMSGMCHKDPNHPDYAPSEFVFKYKKPKQSMSRFMRLHKRNQEKKTRLLYRIGQMSCLLYRNEIFYTGINKLIFIFILNAIQENAKKYSKLMLKDHLLLVLMKLKLGLLHSDLAYRFGINLSKVSRIYRNWLPLLSKFMENPQP